MMMPQLLLSVAELDTTGAVPPACLEIAQLCGRLPLCLSIVGNLIRTFGDGWEDEVARAHLFRLFFSSFLFSVHPRLLSCRMRCPVAAKAETYENYGQYSTLRSIFVGMIQGPERASQRHVIVDGRRVDW